MSAAQRQQGDAFQEALCHEAAESSDPSRLSALAKIGASVAIEVARNPHTPIELLRSFLSMQGSPLQLAAIQNPSAPKDALRDLIGRSSDSTLRALVAQTKDPEVLAPFADRTTFNSSKLGKELAQNIGAPFQVLQALAPQLSRLIIKSREELLARFWRDPSALQPLIEKLRAGQDPWMLSLLTPYTKSDSAEVLSSLAALDVPALNLLLAKNSATPMRYVLSWCQKPTQEMRNALLSNSSLPSEVIDSLQIGSITALPALAANPQTPPYLLNELAERQDGRILLGLTLNPSLSSTLLESLASKSDMYWRADWNLALHPMLPEHCYAKIAQRTADPSLKALLTEQRTLREEASRLANLRATDALALVKDPEISAAMLTCLLNLERFQQELALSCAILRHPKLPASALRWAVRFRASLPERRSILENPNVPAEAILLIAADNRLPLRLAALRHPSFSGDALYQMLSHPEQGVAYLAKRRVFSLFPW